MLFRFQESNDQIIPSQHFTQQPQQIQQHPQDQQQSQSQSHRFFSQTTAQQKINVISFLLSHTTTTITKQQ